MQGEPGTGPERRIKVVRLIPVLDFGGVETTFALEAEGIDRRRFDFRVVTFWKPGAIAERIKALGIPVESLGVDPSIRNPGATLALARLLRRERPDILHASIGEANFHAALTGRLCRVPATIIEEQGLPQRQLFGRAVHAVLYRMVDRVVGVSQASCRYVIEREWAPPARVERIYNAAAQQFYEPLGPPRASDGRFRFITIGRLVEVKNHATLLRAFQATARRNSAAHLTIVGDGPLKDGLASLVADLGLQDRVALPGFRGDVKAALEAADCFVLPSLSEGFGIAAVEAMARGLPTIVSAAGALPEVAADMGREWIVPANDVAGWGEAMTRMASLPEDEYAGLRRKARAVAERYSAESHVDALQQLYLSVLTGSARSLGALPSPQLAREKQV